MYRGIKDKRKSVILISLFRECLLDVDEDGVLGVIFQSGDEVVDVIFQS